MALDLAVLVDRLRSAGFRIDTRQYLLAHELMLAVARHGDEVSGAERLISHLGPIFCTSAEEQERFGLEIRRWMDPTQPVQRDAPTPATRDVRSRRRVPLTVAAWAVALLVLAFAIVQLMRPATPPAETVAEPLPPAEVVAAPPPIPAEPQTAWGMVAAGVVFVSGLAYGSGWLVDRFRRQLALRRLPTADDPERVTLPLPEVRVGLVPDVTVRRAAAALTRPREGALVDVDIEATVEETSRAGGFLTPCFSARRSIEEYVALVSRRGADDHQAAVFDTFLKLLRDRGVAIETYSFHDDPRVCYADDSGQARRLGEIVRRHHRATLLVCADAHVAFNAATGGMMSWVPTTAALERRVLWSPEAPYRWSRFEFELIESGFTVIPTSEDGWRALVDLDNGWRQEALYPASYVRAYPGLIGANERRWLDRNEPPQDIAEKMVRQLGDFLGPRGFAWLCACAVYPEITWNLTLRVAGDAIDYAALPSLARLPWFRHAFMPDWLRRLLVARLPPEAGERLRVDLAGLLEDLAQASGRASGGAAGSALRIARWMQSVRTVDVLRAAPAGSPLRDHVFLGFMARATVDPLGLSVPQPLGRLFGGRVGRFTVPVDRRAASLGRQLLAHIRGWLVFRTRQVRVVQSCALGLLLLTLWRPVREPLAENVIAAAPIAATAPTPETVTSVPGPEQSAIPDMPPTVPDAAPPPKPVNPPLTRTPILTPPREGVPVNPGAAPDAPPQATVPQDQSQTGGGVLPQEQSPVQAADDGLPAGGNADDLVGRVGGRGATTVPGPVQETIDPPGGAAVAAPPNNNNVDTAIRQLLASYASAMESLNPEAVAAVYPRVDTRALANAFREYTSLNEEVQINRIDVAPDGQSATVNAVLSITQQVKIGRAAPVTRNVVFTLRRQGDRWLIDNIK